MGGTHEARDLAVLLREAGFETITSLAGVTEDPILPAGEVRQGGFGGVQGLVSYLKAEGISAIADATHPFAVQITHHAAQAARESGIPCVRLERPPWVPQAGDIWISAARVADAVAAIPSGSRPLVTVGRKEAGLFFARHDVKGFARMIEAPRMTVPANWTLLQQRGPFRLEDEAVLIRRHDISILVTKNAGGQDTAAKLVAARLAGLTVIMIARPVDPSSPVRATAAELAALLTALLSP